MSVYGSVRIIFVIHHLIMIWWQKCWVLFVLLVLGCRLRWTIILRNPCYKILQPLKGATTATWVLCNQPAIICVCLSSIFNPCCTMHSFTPIMQHCYLPIVPIMLPLFSAEMYICYNPNLFHLFVLLSRATHKALIYSLLLRNTHTEIKFVNTCQCMPITSRGGKNTRPGHVR